LSHCLPTTVTDTNYRQNAKMLPLSDSPSTPQSATRTFDRFRSCRVCCVFDEAWLSASIVLYNYSIIAATINYAIDDKAVFRIATDDDNVHVPNTSQHAAAVRRSPLRQSLVYYSASGAYSRRNCSNSNDSAVLEQFSSSATRVYARYFLFPVANFRFRSQFCSHCWNL